MGLNIEAMMKLRGAWNTFRENHPSFPGFIQAVKEKGICEGAMVDICIRYPDGTELKSGMKVKQSDLDLLQTLGSIDLK